MKKLSQLFTLTLLGATLLTSVVGCGNKPADTKSTTTAPTEATSASETTSTEPITLTVGASPSPHAEILEFVKPLLAEKGITLNITEFTDYILPNTALDAGDLDANFFQHLPYLEDFNAKNGTKLVSAAAIHFEPLGIYPGKSTSLEAIPDGAQIAVPSDVTNEARALNLLASLDLIKLKEGAGLAATPKDIIENPHNLTFVEVEAALVARTLSDVDFGIANGNYALEAKIADTVLVSEAKDSEGAKTFANILAVQEGKENDPGIKALIEVLTSNEVAEFINTTYNGLVIPVF